MSYEILLYPRTPEQDWVEVLQADEDEGPEMDVATLNRGVATFRRIEARLREQLTEPVRTWAAEELDGDVLGELQTRDSGLRVDLYDRSASVSAPYGGPSAPVHDLVRQAVEIVAAETGYEAYDPQVQAPWDGTFDEEAGQASLTRVTDQDDLWSDDAGTDEGDDAPDDAEDPAPLEGRVMDEEDQEEALDPRAERARLIQERRQQLMEERRQPAALRRRGWFYVVFGTFVTAFGLMRLSAGNTELLTWLFLGVGVFELGGAWLMFSQARQALERDQPSSGPGQPHDAPDTPDPNTPTPDSPDGPDDPTQR